MRAVFDTNLVVSGLLWKGKPHHVLQAASAGRVETVTSEDLVDELRDVLKRPKLAKYIQRVSRTEEDLVADYLSYTGVVEPVTIPQNAVRDLDDVMVLEAAVGGEANYVVSGDDDLLSLKAYRDIAILNASDFLALLRADDDDTTPPD